MLDFKEILLERALKKNKKICLPEESDKRVKSAKKHLLSLGFEIININQLRGNGEEYIDKILSKPFSKNWTSEMKSNFLSSNLNLSLLALDNGDIDCVVAGAENTTSSVIRSSIRIIGLHPSAKWISSVFFMLSPCGKKLYTFSDCGVIPDPNSEQLCEIAFQASKLHDLVFKELPKVSFLSFSTKGSAKHYKVSKVQDAVKLFSKNHGNIIHDGEMQFDAAVNSTISSKKMPESKLSGDANVFIFPDLNSANIAYKIANHLAYYQSLGPILVGLNKPVNDLSRGCTIDDIIYVSALACLQSN